jgi:hypothetical protein
MFGIKRLSFEFLTSTPVPAVLCLAGLILLTVWIYRRTNPPLATWLRIVLAILRIVAVVALLATLLQPVLSFTREKNRSKRVAVVIDISASMDKIETGRTRAGRLDSLLSQPAYERFAEAVAARTFYFGDHLGDERAKVSRHSTALGEAMAELNQAELAEPSDLWLVFSDGNSNSGRKPSQVAPSLTTVVYTFDMSSDLGNLDIALADIDYNPIVFVGKPTEIKVKLSWQSAAGKAANVRILQGNRLLDSATFQLQHTDGFGEVTLKYVPTEPGQKLLKVVVTPLEGEETTGNNERSISVKVMKSRMAVLFVTEQPDYEAGFLRRHLLQTDRFDVRFLSIGSKAGNLGGTVPSIQTELNRYDLIILHDVSPTALETRQAVISSFLSAHGGAVWWMLGPNFAQSPSPWITRLLPFYPVKSRAFEYTECHGEPVEANLFHPAVRLADERAAIRNLWSSLPPFRTLVRCDGADPASVVLATCAGAADRLPIMGYRRIGPGKIFVTAAGPFWPWGFYNLGLGEDAGAYARFVDGVTSWLTVQDDFDPLRILPQKTVFSRGEPVVFDGFAFDQGYRPLSDVTGSVSLIPSDGKDSLVARFVDCGEGKQKAEFPIVAPGEYTYHAGFDKGSQRLTAKEGKILVEAYSLEEFDQSGNPANLMALAQQAGGSYSSWRDFEKTLTGLSTTPVAQTMNGTITGWGKTWLLLLFAGALAVEWILRKANHLL